MHITKASLRIIKLTWRQVQQAQNQQKVFELANEMLKRVGMFVKQMGDVGKALDNAQKIADTYEEYFNLKKSSGGILSLYTTPSLADDLAEVQGGMLSASYYLSVQKHSVHDLISKKTIPVFT